MFCPFCWPELINCNFYALVTALCINYGTVPHPYFVSSFRWEISTKECSGCYIYLVSLYKMWWDTKGTVLFVWQVSSKGEWSQQTWRSVSLCLLILKICQTVWIFSCRKQACFQRLKLTKTWIVLTQNPCLEASYKAAYVTAKHTKPYMNTEIAVKPCVSWKWFGWFVARKWCHPLWNLRIVCNRSLRNSQVHHSTSACNWTSWCSQLQVLTYYVYDGTIREDFLFYDIFLDTSRAIDILEMLKRYFVKQEFYWRKKNLRTFA